jgi:hypothetical protein|tara:strand:- start:33333 stop:33641 length:309 start_codon:yes stop_codon:yes gene_type:complete
MRNGLIQLGFTPDVDFIVQDDSDGKGAYIGEWHSDKPQPSAEEIKTAQDEYDAEYDALNYSRKRKAEYAKLNQFEMQFDDQRDGTSTWVNAINEIKKNFPKV